MHSAFGDARVIPASEQAKTFMKQLVSKDLFDAQGDVWRLGAALGISHNQRLDRKNMGTMGTAQNINSLDPDGILAAMMVGLLPDATPDERLKRLVEYAEWGIAEIYRKEQNGTLDWATLGLNIQI